MGLPLHEQLSHENWRRMINQAGPGDLEALRRLALTVLDWGIAQRLFTLEQARQLLPHQDAPAAEATGARGDQA